jgi:hypothetical protein
MAFPGGAGGVGMQNGDMSNAVGVPLQMKKDDSGQNYATPAGVSVGSQAVEQQTVSSD